MRPPIKPEKKKRPKQTIPKPVISKKKKRVPRRPDPVVDGVDKTVTSADVSDISVTRVKAELKLVGTSNLMTHRIKVGHDWGFVVKDSYVFVAAGMGGFVVIDATKPESPSLAGRLKTRKPVSSVFVLDDNAYLASETGLSIMDVSDPCAPFRAGEFSIPESEKIPRAGVFARGKGAFLLVPGVDSKSGIFVFDVRNIYNPKYYARFECRAGKHASNIFVRDRYAFTIGGGKTTDLTVTDLSGQEFYNPVATMNVLGRADSLYVTEYYAYLGYGNSLDIIDISLPHKPVLTCSSDIEGAGKICDIFVSGVYAFVAKADEKPLQILNLTDKNDPYVAASCKIDVKKKKYVSHYDWKVYVEKPYVYLMGCFKLRAQLYILKVEVDGF
jgi:hypothetical protein